MKIITCNHCGSPNPSDSKFCQKCGSEILVKEDKKGNSKLLVIISCILAILVVALVVTLIVVINNNAKTNASYMEASRIIEELEGKIASIESENNTLKAQKENINKMYESVQKRSEENYNNYVTAKQELDFYKWNIVFVPEYGRTYHYDINCPDFGSNSFLAYNVENAKAMGYKKCTNSNCSRIK